MLCRGSFSWAAAATTSLTNPDPSRSGTARQQALIDNILSVKPPLCAPVTEYLFRDAG